MKTQYIFINATSRIFYSVLLVATFAILRAHAQIGGSPEGSDFFGRSVATGDFNGDGVRDLAIGVPGEDVGSISNAGAVNVIYGSPGAGLTSTSSQIWDQNSTSVQGAAEDGDNFGFSLASGDFNDDDYDDLAIGVPYEDVGSVSDAGAVNVLYGSALGLTTTGDQIWDQNSTNVEGVSGASDNFGYVLASADFNSDFFDDLAIGVPGEGIGSVIGAGAVNVLHGSSTMGLTATGDEIWHQNSSNIEDVSENFDGFGSSLVVGNFDYNGFYDLAIGVPGEDIGAVSDAGAVNVIYGTLGGLSATGDQIWSQNSANVEGVSGEYDNFGYSLASYDFNADGYADLAIGVPGEDVGSVSGAGAVNVLYGSFSVGLTSTGDQIWNQNTTSIQGASETFDAFGISLTATDFDNDGYYDLAIGVSGEDVGSVFGAGAVNVLYGSSGIGLTATGNQIWDQNSANVEGTSSASDAFGSALASGDFDDDGFDDLAIGVYGEDVGTASAAGAVNVLYGSSGAGLSAAGDQIWHQGSTLFQRDETLAPAADSLIETVLYNAYPNPFASTVILGYDVAEPGWVRLTVYNLFGQEVVVLVDKMVEEGHSSAILDGVGLKPGIYLVRMTTEKGFEQTIRITRLK